MDIKAIIEFLDDFLSRAGRRSIDPVETNALLSKSGLLRDSKDRLGKPLRDLLRKGLLPHASQPGGKGSSWVIPHSNRGKSDIVNIRHSSKPASNNTNTLTTPVNDTGSTDTTALKSKLENARLKYKPKKIKYLLVAEAPPDSLERFFYYESVRQHDYLFLGVSQALYPELKKKFLLSSRSSEIKKLILEKFSNDGFYLLDLSELPLKLLKDSLESQLPHLFQKISLVADNNTKVILIKANVYDIVFPRLRAANIVNVIDVRMPFPGQGGQKQFQVEFKKALEFAGYI